MPECRSCACTYNYATKSCVCECFDVEGESSEGYTKGDFTKLKLNKESIVNVSFRNLPLFHVGNFLERSLKEPVYIPAKNPDVKINLKVKRKKISVIMKKLGLVTKSQLRSNKS